MLISNENVAKLIPGKLEPLNPERLAKEDEFNFIVSIQFQKKVIFITIKYIFPCRLASSCMTPYTFPCVLVQ